MKNLFSLFAILLCLNSFGDTNIDSLKQVWQDENVPDSIRESSVFSICEYYYLSSPDSAIYYANALLSFSKENGSLIGQNFAFSILGAMNGHSGNMDTAVHYFKQAFAISKKLNDYAGMASYFENMGSIYFSQGRNDDAVENYEQSLEYFKKADDFIGISKIYVFLGQVSQVKGDYTSAIENGLKAVRILENNSNVTPEAQIFGILGSFYLDAKEYESSIKYFNIGHQIAVQNNDIRSVSSILHYIGLCHLELGRLDSARIFIKKALNTGISVGSPENIKMSSKVLSDIYLKQEHFEQSLEMYKMYTSMKDSLNSRQTNDLIARHLFEKEQLLKEQKEKEVKLAEIEAKERRNSLEYSAITIALFVLFGLVFLMGKFQLPNWIIEISVFLPILVLFEFILVLTDPFVEEYTQGDPMLKLFINAVLAGFIFPLHGFFERFMKKRLIKLS